MKKLLALDLISGSPFTPNSTRRIKLDLLGLLSLAKPKALSCSCDPTPTFLEDITESTTIVLAEVLQHGALPHRAISQYLTEKLTKRTAATNSHLPKLL